MTVKLESDNPAPKRQSPPKRAWQRMLSGRRLDLLDPSPLDVEIEDIAHGLARVARWNGQTLGDHAFSVAQHSMLVMDIMCALYPDAPRTWRLAALLHDSPEYVLGDLISPFKAVIGLDYKAFERRLLEVIHVRFGLPSDLPVTVIKLIKRADRMAAYFEATSLAGFSTSEAETYFGAPHGFDEATAQRFAEIYPMPPSEAQSRYLKYFSKFSLS